MKTLKFDSQLGVWLKKFKTKDQIIKGMTLRAEIDQIKG